MNFLGIVRKIYPSINALSALGGPFAVMGAGMVGKALGVDKVDPTPDAISAAIAGATPEQVIALKQVELDAEAKLKEMGFENAQAVDKMINDDIANARAMHTANPKDFTPEVLAGAITIGFFTTLWVVFIHGVNPATHDLAIGMVNVLGTAWVCVVTFYFGSSKGSANKDAILGGIAKQP
jgi:hypothetical protein